MSMKRLWTIAYGILPLLFFLGSSDTLWAQRDRHIGVLLATEHPTDATQPNVLALMTDRDTLLLRNETGAFIPAQEPLSLSGYSVQLDSVYSLRMIRLKETENAFEYKEVEQCYKGNPYTRLQGYFRVLPMGNDPNGIPLPGVLFCFKAGSQIFYLADFKGLVENGTRPDLGGALREVWGIENQPICDVLFIQIDDKTLIPYKLFSKTSVSLSEISMPDISIADRGRGSCEVKTTSSPMEILVFNVSGQLLYRRSIADLYTTIQDLPRREPLLFLIKVPYHTYTFKTLLR